MQLPRNEGFLEISKSHMSTKPNRTKRKHGPISPEARARKRRVFFFSMLGIVVAWLILSFYLVLSGNLEEWMERKENPPPDPRMERLEDF